MGNDYSSHSNHESNEPLRLPDGLHPYPADLLHHPGGHLSFWYSHQKATLWVPVRAGGPVAIIVRGARSGELIVKNGGPTEERRPFKGDSVFWIPLGFTYAVRLKGPGFAIVYQFAPRWIEGAYKVVIRKVKVRPLNDYLSWKPVISELLHELREDKPHFWPRDAVLGCGGAVAEQLLLAHRKPRLKRKLIQALTLEAEMKIRDYVDLHLNKGSIDWKTLAGQVSLSLDHFNRRFKRTIGLSPTRYFLNRRLLRARDLLRTHQYNVTDVAAQCGFSNQHAFTVRFKRRFGESPRPYIPKSVINDTERATDVEPGK